MNYGIAFVFSYERFENVLICIISIGPSTELRPIFDFPIFRKNGALLELLNIVFEYCIFVELIKNLHFLIWRQILDIYRQRLLILKARAFT